MCRALLLMLVASPLIAADTGQNESLKGVWKIDEWKVAGKDMPDEQRKQMSFEFKGDKLTITAKSKSLEATYLINPSKSPATIDITVKQGEKTSTLKGIYELKGDTLTMPTNVGDRRASR